MLPVVDFPLTTPTPGSELLMKLRLTSEGHFNIQRNGAQLEGYLSDNWVSQRIDPSEVSLGSKGVTIVMGS